MVVAATLSSALLAFGLGALWYSPWLFGGLWHRAVDRPAAALRARPRLFVLTAIIWLFAAAAFAVLAHGLVADAGAAPTFAELYTLAVVGWLAFTVPHLVMATLFQGGAGILLWIDGGYHLLAMLVMAVVHAVLT